MLFMLELINVLFGCSMSTTLYFSLTHFCFPPSSLKTRAFISLNFNLTPTRRRRTRGIRIKPIAHSLSFNIEKKKNCFKIEVTFFFSRQIQLIIMNSVFSLFIFFLISASASVPVISGLNSDGEVLLSLLNKLIVPNSIKSSWNSSNSTTPCEWLGIECNHKRFVVSLNLSGYGVSGKLGHEIGNLKYLNTIDLRNNSIFGEIPKELGNCSELQYLDLSLNSLTGKLPETLGNLKQLSVFSVYSNFLSGGIPEYLFHIPVLDTVLLSTNNFTGSIPLSVGNATALVFLWVDFNQFSGMVPKSIGDCTKLEELYLNNNNLVGDLPISLNNLEFLTYMDVSENSLEGRIPFTFDRCENLNQLILSDNLFTGEIPVGLGNCSSLTIFGAVSNSLTGHIPSTLGLLTKLVDLFLADNHLSGKIPGEIGKCRSLKKLVLQENQLEGEIPVELGMLSNLQLLRLFANNLTGEIPLEIWKIPTLEGVIVYNNSLSGTLPLEMTKLRQLRNLSLFNNHFSGAIPKTLGVHSSLELLDFTNNKFSGEIPPHLCFGQRLRVLNLGLNRLQGSIPTDVGRCSALERLILKQNELTGFLPAFTKSTSLSYIDVSANGINGTIPSSLGYCTNLTSINLSMNKLSGPIPLELGNLVNLQRLVLSYNNLQGSLPPQISKCNMLDSLDVGSNLLNGSIPLSFRSLTQLSSLILKENQFTGGIPDFLQELEKLLELQLGGNLLKGSIPPSLGELHNLEYVLNLSGNGLTGEIPLEFEKLTMLQKLDISHNNLTGSLFPLHELHSLLDVNVSYNRFTGSIPETLMKLPRFTLSSFLGNLDLCVTCQLDGFSCVNHQNFSICGHRSSDRKHPNITLIVGIALGSLLFCFLMIVLACFIFLRCRKGEQRAEIFDDQGSSLLLNEVMEATGNLNDRFIIGRGAHGTVYKASLDSGKLYAVKKLELLGQKGASVSMIREIKTVGEIRHRNLVRLEDFWMRKDYGLILYNYMENGSLHDVLHEISPPLDLNWDVRYRIALGTAHGLSYLHYDCSPTIVHRDIKPKNILLDSDMEPHISDFGIAKLVDQSSASVNTISIMGTVGYIPPETAFTTTTTMAKIKKWDVYSFGVVLLELITRKKALDSSFEEDTDIVRWVQSNWRSNEGIKDIVDQSLLEEFMGTSVIEEVTEVMSVALQCTTKDPNERPTMRDVVKRLIDAKIHVRMKM